MTGARGRAVVLLVTAVLALTGTGTAHAFPPIEVEDGLTDHARVLESGRVEAERALADLATTTGAGLHAVLVPSFLEVGDRSWAEQTARRSGLGSSDMLLAVAVQDGSYEYSWWLGDAFPVPAAEIEEAIVRFVEPAMNAGAWAGAVSALAEQLRLAAPALVVPREEVAVEPWSRETTATVVGGWLAVLLVAHVASRRRAPAH